MVTLSVQLFGRNINLEIIGRSFSKERLLVKCSNEHTTLESRKIECFLEWVTNDIQLWKFSHSFEMLGFI